MRLTGAQPWDDGNLGPKLLGTYEIMLRPWLREVVRNTPSRIINVGCAEGYYAAGLGMLLPDTTIIATDVANECLKACRENCALNDVHPLLGKELTAGILSALINHDTFIMMDCEGAEINLLDPEMCPNLRQADIIVECHDFIRNDDISTVIAQRLAPTHAVHVIHGSEFDTAGWNEAANHRALDDFTPEEQSAVLDDMRPDGAIWLCAMRRD